MIVTGCGNHCGNGHRSRIANIQCRLLKWTVGAYGIVWLGIFTMEVYGKAYCLIILLRRTATGRTVFDSNKLTRFEWLAADSVRLCESLAHSILRMSFTYELRSLCALRALRQVTFVLLNNFPFLYTLESSTRGSVCCDLVLMFAA